MRWHGNTIGNLIKVGYGGKKIDFKLLFHLFDFQDNL